MTLARLLIALAVLAFLVAVVLGAGMFGTHATTDDTLVAIAAGLALYTGAAL